MESGSTNLSDIYRKEAFLRCLVSSRRYNRHYNRRYDSLKFLFHLPEAIIKVLSVRTRRENLNLTAGPSFSIFLPESRITGACVSLMNRVNIL